MNKLKTKWFLAIEGDEDEVKELSVRIGAILRSAYQRGLIDGFQKHLESLTEEGQSPLSKQ